MSKEMTVDIVDLEQKLLLYSTQMDQIDELLLLDNDNKEFLQLKKDLEQIILVTKELLIQTLNNNIILNNDIKDKEIIIEKEKHINDSIIRVGDVIEVHGSDRLYSGVVIDILNETEYRIKYFEFPDVVSLPVSSINKLNFIDYQKHEIYEGLSCECKYTLDKKYYKVTVTKLTQYGCTVTYTEYGNSEEVPLQYLRPIGNNTTTSFKPNSSKIITQGNSKYTKTNGIVPIPESLTILPTDTEKEIEKKKKELKLIKNKNRMITKEIEIAEAQQSWKSFVTKGSKRALVGTVKSNSMFTSPEFVSGKVGVINSGKGMTNFIPRKKHQFEMN